MLFDQYLETPSNYIVFYVIHIQVYYFKAKYHQVALCTSVQYCHQWLETIFFSLFVLWKGKCIEFFSHITMCIVNEKLFVLCFKVYSILHFFSHYFFLYANEKEIQNLNYTVCCTFHCYKTCYHKFLMNKF